MEPIYLTLIWISVLSATNKLEIKNGLVVLTVPLVVRQEKCLFTLRPVNDNVGNFIEYLKNEDKGIEKVNLYTIGIETVSL